MKKLSCPLHKWEESNPFLIGRNWARKCSGCGCSYNTTEGSDSYRELFDNTCETYRLAAKKYIDWWTAVEEIMW